MSGNAPPIGWQRHQVLLDRLADIQTEVEEVRSTLPGVNDVALRSKVEGLIALAAELVVAHGTRPGNDVAEALAELQSTTRQLRVPPSDPDLGVTGTLRTLRAAQGRLRSAVDDALEAVRGTGLAPQDIPAHPIRTDRPPSEAMLQRLDEVAKRLDVLESAAAQPTTLVQQTGLVNLFVGRMRVHVDAAKLTLTIGDDTFDFGALMRAAEAMGDLTADFADTIRTWAQRLANRLSPVVVRTAEEARARVRKVATGAGTLGRWLRKRMLRAAETAFAPPETVPIPPGSFRMGVPQAESQREKSDDDDDARPVHRVTVRRGFHLMRYPVTRGGFAAFVAATGHDMSGGAYGYVSDKGYERSNRFSWQDPGFPQTDRDPVVCVSWHDAVAYADWLSRETGQQWRLPSEAEWEYAARAKTTTARFWGDGWDQASRYARVEAEGTTPVGSFQPNDFGLYDMLGNVWEWVADPWHTTYENAPTDGSVWSEGGDAGFRVLRGGAWDDYPRLVRAGVRSRNGADNRNYDAGFRLARTSF
jgi:formylglycine-generating enzyme required for sulfatase activity